MDSAPKLSLSVGDRVVYPNQGLCTVTDIKNEEIAGQKLVFVSLTVIETGAKVKAPQEKLVRIGIRRVSTNDDVKRVFDYLKGDSEKASLDWKKRSRDNTLRLSEGGLRGLAEVVKDLQVLSELRPLPPKERELYNDARHLFVTELAAAMSIGEADAEDALDVVLFPVGKERPKRTIEEFKSLAGEDDELGLGDDLLGLDGETDAEPAEAEGEKPEAGEEAEGDGDGDGDGDGESDAGGAAEAAPKKRGRPPKAKAEAKGLRSVLSDNEVTQPAGTALPIPPPPKKRGRPPKVKDEAAVAAPPEPPKKRGRPPKAKPAEPEVPAEPKKRGRPPKAKK